MNKKLLAYLLILAISPLLLLTEDAEASSHPSPEVFANASFCNRSISEANDIFCQIRYELPQDAASDWCSELADTTGCTSSPVNPTAPKSLPSGLARIAMYQDCAADCSAGSIVAIRDVPRIHHGISALYLPSSASALWEDTTVRMCVESVPGAFTTDEQACLTPDWSDAANITTDQREDAGENLVTNLTNLQADRNVGINEYVSNGLITDAGTVFAKEMLESAVIFFPSVFNISATILNQGIATPGASQLNANIQATATAYVQSFEDFGSIISPTGGPEIGGLILFGALGMITFVLVYARTQEFIWPSIGMAAWGLFGVAAGGIDSSVVFVYLVMISMPAMVFIYGRIGFAR